MEKKYSNDTSLELVLNKVLAALEHDQHTDTAIDSIIADHPQYASDINEYRATWMDIGTLAVPETRPEMDAQFYKMLSDMPTPKPQPNMVISTITKWAKDIKVWGMIGALAIGYFIGNNNAISDDIRFEIEEPQKLSKQPNASIIYTSHEKESNAFEKIEEIQKSRELPEPSTAIIEAINKALLYDNNVNVRLSALETMIVFSDHPKVRQYLIKSIPFQDSPIVLIELAELMSALEEKQSAEAWKEVLDSDNTEIELKNHLEEKLSKIL